MPDMPMPPMPTKWMGPIWFGSFMVSQTPGRPDTRSIGPKNGRPHKAIPLIWETAVFSRSQSRAVNGHFRFRDALRPPHMHPKAIKTNAVEPALGRGGVKERREAEHLRRLASEQLRLDDPNAGIDERRDMARLTRLKPSVVSHDEITGPVDADRPRAGRNQQQDVHRLWIETSGQARNIRARPLDPEGVGVADQERIPADQRQGALDPAALVEQLRALVGDDDLRRPALGELRLDLVGKPMHVDDRPLAPVLRQPIEAIIEERPAMNLDQRLRQRLRDRPHACPQSGGEHHGRLRNGKAHRASAINLQGQVFLAEARAPAIGALSLSPPPPE